MWSVSGQSQGLREAMRVTSGAVLEVNREQTMSSLMRHSKEQRIYFELSVRLLILFRGVALSFGCFRAIILLQCEEMCRGRYDGNKRPKKRKLSLSGIIMA